MRYRVGWRRTRKNPIRYKAARYREREKDREAARTRDQLLHRPSKCRESRRYARYVRASIFSWNRTVPGGCTLSLSLYAPPRRKRALATRGLLPSGYTARDLVRDVLVPSRRLLLSYRVSTRQTSDTNRLFGRNKSPRQIFDLFDCYASSYPLSQSAFELGIIRGRQRSPGVPGTCAFNRGNRIRFRTVQKALPCVVSVRKRRVTDSDRK